jgi:ketosteroid isomerase-like protein
MIEDSNLLADGGSPGAGHERTGLERDPSTDARIDTIRDLFDAFGRGDSASLDLLDPECELQNHPAVDSGWHRGRKGAVEWAVKYWEVFGQAQVETSDFVLLADGRVLVRYRARAQGKRSGATVEMTGYGVFTFREGRILRAAAFETRAEALAAVGLSE